MSAGSCVDANIASTATIVRGEKAAPWLEALGLPSRLVATTEPSLHVGGWPADGDDLPSRRPSAGGPDGQREPRGRSDARTERLLVSARGTGAVALVLLTASVVIGIVGPVRVVGRAMAAVRDRRSPPRRLVAGGRRARDPHRDQRARRVRADHACSTGSSRLSRPIARCGWVSARWRSICCSRSRHEPRPPAARLRAWRACTGSRSELAGRGAARARDRQRRKRGGAGADRRLRRRRAGRGLDAHRPTWPRSTPACARRRRRSR